MMTRRHAIKTTLLAAAAAPTAFAQDSVSNPTRSGIAATPASTSGPFVLPPLPYAYDALEPYIDAQTMHIHHDKHHAAYVANLNKAISADSELPDGAKYPVADLMRDLGRVPENIRTIVRNNGGGDYNHSLFWLMMKKGGGGQPSGELATAIDSKFRSFAAFKDQFTKAALGQFGSGWAWLTANGRELAIESTSNQDTPWSSGRLPLLGLDVWEHAYYLKYQNKRADYVSAWWNVVNWDFVSDQFAKAK